MGKPSATASPDAERWRPERQGRGGRRGARDELAERILLAHHTAEWYIGDATQAEWEMAYAAADAALKERTDG